MFFKIDLKKSYCQCSSFSKIIQQLMARSSNEIQKFFYIQNKQLCKTMLSEEQKEYISSIKCFVKQYKNKYYAKFSLKIYFFMRKLLKICAKSSDKISRSYIAHIYLYFEKNSLIFRSSILQETFKKLLKQSKKLISIQNQKDQRQQQKIIAIGCANIQQIARKRVKNNPSCLGCLKALYENDLCSFQQFSKDYVLVVPGVFENNEKLTALICGVINSQKQYIIVTNNFSIQNQLTKVEVLRDTRYLKTIIRNKLNQCIKFIEPSVQKIDFLVQQIPILSQAFFKKQQKVVYQYGILRISISIEPHKHIFFISQQHTNSFKNLTVNIYNIQNHQIINPHILDVYNKIHIKFKKHNPQKLKLSHRNIQCDKINHNLYVKNQLQDEKIQKKNFGEQKVPKNYKNQHLITILTQYDYEGLFQKIKNEFSINKILCQFLPFTSINDKMKNSKKYYFLKLYCNCTSQTVKKTMKNCNKQGQIKLYSPTLAIVIKDTLFLNQSKLKSFQSVLKQKLQIQGYIVHPQSNKTNINKNLQVTYQFNSVQSSIVTFCWLVNQDVKNLQFK